MTFKLTDEQLMIQSMVREFSRKVVAATAMERDRTKAFPKENLTQMGELGLLGMMVPLEYDGSDADTVSYVLALSEIAYSCASTAVGTPEPNSEHVAAASAADIEQFSLRLIRPALNCNRIRHRRILGRRWTLLC